MSSVDQTFDAIVAAENDEPVRVTVGGHQFTMVKDPPAGALLMMMRRMDDSDSSRSMSAVIRLLEKWIIPEEHEALWDAVENIQTIAELNQEDLPKIIQAASGRPT